MTPPPLIALHNRFQALTEEADSGDKAEGEPEGSSPVSGEGPSASLHLSTPTQFGSRVKTDGRREPFQMLHREVANSQEEPRSSQLLA